MQLPKMVTKVGDVRHGILLAARPKLHFGKANRMPGSGAATIYRKRRRSCNPCAAAVDD